MAIVGINFYTTETTMNNFFNGGESFDFYKEREKPNYNPYGSYFSTLERKSTALEQLLIGDKAWTVPLTLIGSSFHHAIGNAQDAAFRYGPAGAVVGGILGFAFGLFWGTLLSVFEWPQIEYNEIVHGTPAHGGLNFR